jgi:hypothetical protein
VFHRFSVPKIDYSNEFKSTGRQLSEPVILDSPLNCSVEKRKKNTLWKEGSSPAVSLNPTKRAVLDKNRIMNRQRNAIH